jgi:hypothetical protein
MPLKACVVLLNLLGNASADARQLLHGSQSIAEHRPEGVRLKVDDSAVQLVKTLAAKQEVTVRMSGSKGCETSGQLMQRSTHERDVVEDDHGVLPAPGIHIVPPSHAHPHSQHRQNDLGGLAAGDHHSPAQRRQRLCWIAVEVDKTKRQLP